MSGKYVVFRKDEFQKWFNEWPEVADDGPESIEDAVVIRRQDAFAPPALDAYANSIQTLLEMVGYGVKMDIETYGKLQETADYFHDQAVTAWNTKRKLPD